MSAHVYKSIEITGSSPDSSDDAIRKAIEKAAQSVHHMDWFEVIETRGHIVDGKVGHYQVTLKIGWKQLINPKDLVFVAVAFVLVGIFHISLLVTLVCLAPLAIWLNRPGAKDWGRT